MQKKIVSTTKAPGAIGPYSQGITLENLVFSSGQLPVNPETGKLVTESIEEATHQVLKNLSAVLAEAGSSLENVIKTTVFLSDMEDFAKMNGVYAEYFNENPPARSCVEVAKLPMNALVEVEAIAYK